MLMTTTECISQFIVPIMLGGEAAAGAARTAVEQFVASYAGAPTGPLAALYELKAALIDMDLHGFAAESLMADIQARILMTAAN